jgi:hypothetical protein
MNFARLTLKKIPTSPYAKGRSESRPIPPRQTQLWKNCRFVTFQLLLPNHRQNANALPGPFYRQIARRKKIQDSFRILPYRLLVSTSPLNPRQSRVQAFPPCEKSSEASRAAEKKRAIACRLRENPDNSGGNVFQGSWFR